MDGKDGHGVNDLKIFFFCLYAMPAEITQESLWLAIPVSSSGSSFLLLVT